MKNILRVAVVAIVVLLAVWILAGCTLTAGGQSVLGIETEKDKDGKPVPAFGTVITVHQYNYRVQPAPNPPGTPPLPPKPPATKRDGGARLDELMLAPTPFLRVAAAGIPAENVLSPPSKPSTGETPAASKPPAPPAAEAAAPAKPAAEAPAPAVTLPPAAPYREVYRGVYNDPTIRTFVNRGSYPVRVKVGIGEAEFRLLPWQSTADIAFPPGKHQVRIISERPTANFGTLEVVTFMTIFVRPDGGGWEPIYIDFY